MEPGWFVLFLLLLTEMVFVTLLVMPFPNNKVRGDVTNFVAKLWEMKEVQYTVFALLALDLLYFYSVFNALLHPLYDFGFLSPVEMAPSCEAKKDMFRNERNSYITGMSIFLFFVLQRLVDIQGRLFEARRELRQLKGPEESIEKVEESGSENVTKISITETKISTTKTDKEAKKVQ